MDDQFPQLILAPIKGWPRHLREWMYTVLAPWYDLMVPAISSRAREIGLQWLNVQSGEYVLDVGTGTGLAFSCLLSGNPGGWTEGVDVTPAMLNRARRRAARHPHTHYRLREHCASHLPYPNQQFDAVFSSYLIDVIPVARRPAVLREMHRVLKPKGRLVLVFLSPPKRLPERMWTMLAQLFPPLLGGACPLDLLPLLKRCGFSPRNHTTCVQLGLRSAIVKATPL